MVHHFWTRFLLVKDRMMDCCDQEIIATFQYNCRDRGILNTLARRHVQNFTEILDLVHKYCTMESAWKAQQMRVESTHAEQTRKARAKRVYPWRSPEHEPAEKKNRSLAGPRTVLDELLDKPCPIHSVLLNTNPTHSLRACWVVKHVAKGGEDLLDNAESCNKHLASSSDDYEILMIYETHPSRNQ